MFLVLQPNGLHPARTPTMQQNTSQFFNSAPPRPCNATIKHFTIFQLRFFTPLQQIFPAQKRWAPATIIGFFMTPTFRPNVSPKLICPAIEIMNKISRYWQSRGGSPPHANGNVFRLNALSKLSAQTTCGIYHLSRHPLGPK